MDDNQRESIVLDSINEGVFTVDLDWRVAPTEKSIRGQFEEKVIGI